MTKKVNRFLLIANFYAFIVNGILVLMTGAIMPYLMEDFGFSYDFGGLLLFLQAIGNLSAGIFSGIVAAYIGRKNTLIIGAVGFFIGFGGILISPSTLWLLMCIFVSGIGWGTVNNLCNIIVSDATGGDGGKLNLLHMFFAIGAFISPFLVGFCVRAGLGWRIAVIFGVVLAAILAFVILSADIETPEKKGEKGRVSFNFLSDKRYYIFMGMLFFYVGSENSINGWLVTYLIRNNVLGETGAQSILSLLWIVVIFGRLLCAYLSRIYKREKILFASSIGIVLFFLLFLISKSPVIIVISVVGLGISLSGIYPTTVANASSLIEGSGTASGIMFSCGGLGASIIPYIVGLLSEGNGIFIGMTAIMASNLLLFLLSGVNTVSGRKA